jgi:uncharacterized protein involved in exopolysaccharide biosynthesis
MSMMDSELSPGEAGELFDLRQVRNVMGLVLRSVRRHWVRALAAFVSILSAAILLGYSTPKTFLSYSKLQLKPTNTSDYTAPNQNRNVPDPRAGVKETVIRQKNLQAIVQDLNLVKDMEANPGLLGKLLGGNAVGDPAAKELDAITELRDRITVDAPTEPGIYEATIAVTWTDPVIARDIALRLQNNFISDRRSDEVLQIEKIVTLLEQQAVEATQIVEEVRARIGTANSIEVTATDQADLTSATTQQNDASSTLRQGRLSLAAAKTDFDARYAVAADPEIPKRALTSSSKTYVLGFGAGLLAAFFVAAMADLLKGAFVESWQITRKLNVPVLAEVGD